jgi:hypothetical protein
MTGSLSYSRPAPPPRPEAAPRGFFGVIADLFSQNRLANILFIVAIIIGFFHGWIKMRYRSTLSTFAFDIPLMAALAVTVLTRSDKEPLFPKTDMSQALKLMVGTTALYGLLSLLIWDVPILAVLSAFRGWCAIPLVFLLGYHLATSVRQVEFYIWLVIVLGAITGLYGIFQTEDEIKRLMALDPELEFRLRNSFYHTEKGAQFRRFSTFVSAAVFATQMCYSVMFAFSRLSVKTCPWLERIPLLIMAGIMSYAVVLTGSRSSLGMLILALGFTVWYRRGGLQMLLVPAVLAVAIKLGSAATEGASSGRFASALDGKQVWWRFFIVFQPAFEEFLTAPLGSGLGTSSHGVPMFLLGQLAGKLRPIDGDFGKLVVDMGILGLVTFLRMMWIGVRDAFMWMSRLRDTPLSVISLPAGIFFVVAASNFPTGSPFLGIPFGAILWFFLGALGRLTADYDRMIKDGDTQSAAFQEKFLSFITPKRERLLYSDDGTVEGPITVTSPVAQRRAQAQREQPRSGKRFLYYRPPADR